QGGWNINARNGGTLELTGLSGLSAVYNLTINDTGGPLVNHLTSLDGVSANLDGSDLHVADSWTHFTRGNLTVTGGSYSLPNLTRVDQSALLVQGGGQLPLPGLSSYAANGFYQADGPGSVLAFPTLRTSDLQGGWNINARNGGTLELTGLSSLSA